MIFKVLLLICFCSRLISCERERDTIYVPIAKSHARIHSRNHSETTDLPLNFTNDPRQDSWPRQFPNLPILFATSSTLPNNRCGIHARAFLDALHNSTLWAVQMFDASTKYPDGVIYGHVKHFGNFDQCYELSAELPSNRTDSQEVDEVTGRYCLVDLGYRRKTIVSKILNDRTLDFDPNQSVWEAIDFKEDFRRINRSKIQVALCVPAACSASEIEDTIATPVSRWGDIHGLVIETTVQPVLCQAKSDYPKQWPFGVQIFAGIATILLILVLGCSLYDSYAYQATDHDTKDLLLCFSIRRNLRSLFATTPSNHPNLEPINGIRLILMLQIVIGHGLIRYAMTSTSNSSIFEPQYIPDVPYEEDDLEWHVYVVYYTMSSGMLIFNISIVVDGFFGIGGLLMAYFTLERLERSKRVDLKMMVVKRWLRILPPYMTVVFFYAFVLPHLGAGPLWKEFVGNNAENCARNWWTNLFFVNNIVNVDGLCMIQSWYLAADFHLFAVGLMAIWCFSKLPRKLGYLLLSGLLIFGLGVSFYVNYTRILPPITYIFAWVDEPRKVDFFVDYYVKSYLRIGPYAVGVLTGAILHDYRVSTWRLSKTWSRLLFAVLVPLCTIFTQCYALKYYDPSFDFALRPIESAIYACLHRTLYSFGICAIVVLIAIGDGLDTCYEILSSSTMAVLSRMSYVVFLIHNIYQLYDTGTHKNAQVLDTHAVITTLIIDIIYAFALTVVVALAIELPIQKFFTIVFHNGPTSGKPERSSWKAAEKIE